MAAAGCEGVPPGTDVGTDDVSVVQSAVTSGAAKIACGNTSGVSPFVADTDFTGGGTVTRANTIDLSAVYNPAPAALYQSQRYGNFSYTVGGFGAASWNQVRLHFADTHWNAAGARVFNVTINGTTVLKNFDIIKLVGAGNKALIEQFTFQANSSGQYVIAFTTVTDAATVSGIEVGPVTWSGTPTTNSGTAYAKQCQQQLVPLPPSFGGSGTCAACFQGTGSCTGCKAGAWTYSGQLSPRETQQSFNGPGQVEMFYYESTDASAPGLCMMAARKGGDLPLDFAGVICQSAFTGAECFWDLGDYSKLTWNGNGGTANEDGHMFVPTTALVVTSTTSSSTTWVGGASLTADNTAHQYQNECSDCHAGRNGFNNHPMTATDLPGRGLIGSATDWFPVSWPSPIVPAWDPGAASFGKPWPLNPGPEPTTGIQNSVCFSCHTEGGIGGSFPSVSMATPRYCGVLLTEATRRSNDNCSSSDINCPTGAMPFSYAPTQPTFNDPFPKAMLAHQTGQCSAEFRTTLATPRLASGSAPTLSNTAQALATSQYYYQQGYNAKTWGINSSGKVVSYDAMARKWSTSTTSASQISIGTDGSLWTIKNSGGVSTICATIAGDCSGATCTWKCDSIGYSSYAGIVAGTGQVVWAIDNGKRNLWAYAPNGTGNYPGDDFFAMGEWPANDLISTIGVGGDGDMWVLTSQGHVQHQVGGVLNAQWTTVTSPPGGTTVSLAVANASEVWTASNTGLYRWDPTTSSWEKHCYTSACNTSFALVSAGGQDEAPDGSTDAYHPIDQIADVWALDTAGNAYRVDRTKGTTVVSLVKIPGATLSRLSVGGQGDVVGMTSGGTVYSFQ
ncbi:MAG TPA: malectin domain-containing carbohydrate-binding protein [Polyangia bacterium]|nr:malectin domain-containing carbohydrate-binding protein [Polyangia bacterium]